MPEEESFAVVVKLMQEYRLREMFKPSMAQLGLCMYQLKHLVEVRCRVPKLELSLSLSLSLTDFYLVFLAFT